MSNIATSKLVRSRHANSPPIYGTELVYDENKTEGIHRIIVITGYFRGNALVGNRSVWRISSLRQTAILVEMSTWTAPDDPQDKVIWKSITDLHKVWAKHRKTIATFLMAQWELGKLHGRIVDTLV